MTNLAANVRRTQTTLRIHNPALTRSLRRLLLEGGE
jgi:hypothetical protein